MQPTGIVLLVFFAAIIGSSIWARLDANKKMREEAAKDKGEEEVTEGKDK